MTLGLDVAVEMTPAGDDWKAERSVAVAAAAGLMKTNPPGDIIGSWPVFRKNIGVAPVAATAPLAVMVWAAVGAAAAAMNWGMPPPLSMMGMKLGWVGMAVVAMEGVREGKTILPLGAMV